MSLPSRISYAMPLAESFPANRVDWLLSPHRAVLLIHDMQEYFLDAYGASSPLRERLQENVLALRSWARLWGVPVVYTAQPWQQSAEERGLLTDMWGPGITAADPALQRMPQELAPLPEDTVLVKRAYSAFQRSPLEDLLRQWRRDQLLVCGIYAHIGCLMTVSDAFMRGIQPFLAGDAVADFSAEEHAMALWYVAGRCGRVISCVQVQARHPQGTFSPEWLLQQILARVPNPVRDFDRQANLHDYGLHPRQVADLAQLWRAQGIAVDAQELANAPTFNQWWALVQERHTGAGIEDSRTPCVRGGNG